MMNEKSCQEIYAEVGALALRKANSIEAARLWGRLVDYYRAAETLAVSLGRHSDAQAINVYEGAARERRDANYLDAQYGEKANVLPL